MSHRTRTRLALLVLACAIAVPAAARDGVVAAGVDLWRTPDDGKTFVDFTFSPVPADFFCPGSEAFSGRLTFRGVPLATEPPGVLGTADTVIERLADASFDTYDGGLRAEVRGADGVVRPLRGAALRGRLVAVTPIQVRGIHFEAVRPLSTRCGSFGVSAGLVGRQPVTEMIIVQDRDGGGRFFAPLSLNVRLTFTPLAGGPARSLDRAIHFPAKFDTTWAEDGDGVVVRYAQPLRVDSDADGVADAAVRGTSNFAAGVRASGGGAFFDSALVLTPYCGGTIDDGSWAEHCHQIGPVLETY